MSLGLLGIKDLKDLGIDSPSAGLSGMSLRSLGIRDLEDLGYDSPGGGRRGSKI